MGECFGCGIPVIENSNKDVRDTSENVIILCGTCEPLVRKVIKTFGEIEWELFRDAREHSSQDLFASETSGIDDFAHQEKRFMKSYREMIGGEGH
jgi:hypothetical protein